MQDQGNQNQNSNPAAPAVPETKPQDEKPAFMSVEVESDNKIPILETNTNPNIQNLENIIPNSEPLIATAASSNAQGPSRIATMLGLLVFAIGMGAGLLLLRARQNFSSRAWDCKHYIFNVSESGVVTVNTQDNTKTNLSSQKANVLINNTLIKTFDIPTLQTGQTVTLGTIDVSSYNNQFSWKVVGTSDCSSQGLYAAQTASPTPTESPNASPSASPTATPTGSPTASPSPTGTPISCSKSVDVMLVLDRSSSMNSKEPDGRTKLAWAIDGAKTFVNTIAAATGLTARIGLTSFGAQGDDGTGKLSSVYNSTLDLALNSSIPTVLSAINKLKFIKEGTCIECGIRIGNKALSFSTVEKYLILLSDGKANHTWDGTSASKQAIQNAQTEALLGRNSGIIYYVLGYGSNANETVLKNIAGDGSRYYFSPTTTDWNKIFTQIGQRICTSPTPSSTPNFTAQCVALTVYNREWSQIAIDNLSSLKAEDVIRFSVAGTSSSAGFDKARFIVNGIIQPETSSKRPGTDDFYYEYTIPTGSTSFVIGAQLHHSLQNQWY